MTLLTAIAYQIAALELTLIGVLAWRYNGRATSGAGKLVGPLAIAIAALAWRMYIYHGFVAFFGEDVSDSPVWQPMVLGHAVAICLMAFRVCRHMIRGVLATREVAP